MTQTYSVNFLDEERTVLDIHLIVKLLHKSVKSHPHVFHLKKKTSLILWVSRLKVINRVLWCFDAFYFI